MAYFSFELSDADNQQVEKHLAQCPACHEKAALIEQLTLEWQHPTKEAPVDFSKQIMRRTRAPLPRRKKKKLYYQLSFAALAALLFLQFNLPMQIIQFTDQTVNAVHSTSKKFNQVVQHKKNGFQKNMEERKDGDFKK
ncbi:anti-sigma factor family protein [Listeria costaricensis]|uniref:anti-sigma factor family protein n=1 Tax=Listeria costaricensis TaxID=2026604 RepID=UPI0013C536BA|nr:zf-HC2 domain-containing protein [Listeria costaricensis]